MKMEDPRSGSAGVPAASDLPLATIANPAYEVLFDQSHYERACRQEFRSRAEAFAHYLSTGEAQGCDPSPFFDSRHYREQAGDHAGSGLLGHYVETGHGQELNPTRIFEQRWYGWQNPDYAKTHSNPYLHYLEIGRAQGRDPSPMVDIVRYGEVIGPTVPKADYYGMILAGVRSPALGVYESWQDLAEAQARFRSSLSLYAAKTALLRAPRRSLVFLQCGRQSRHREWLTLEGREFDLLVNYYDHAGFDPGLGDYVFFQPGTKFTAISQLWAKFRHLLLQYDHILALDDDILVSTPKLNRLFQHCHAHRLDLAQMSLSRQSHCVWDLFFTRPGSALRYVSGVEIMMPVLSRRALMETGDDFARAVSGFGLDLLIGKKLLNSQRNNIAIIDEVVADHLKPIDQDSGGFYSYLRSCHINAKAELWHLITEFGLELGFRQLN